METSASVLKAVLKGNFMVSLNLKDAYSTSMSLLTGLHGSIYDLYAREPFTSSRFSVLISTWL